MVHFYSIVSFTDTYLLLLFPDGIPTRRSIFPLEEKYFVF
jgi:hypothetical protein